MTPETLEKYQGKVPELLLAIWERHGLTSHGQGELWFTNPDDFTDIVQAFFGDQYPFIVYARTSFGRLWAILDDRLYTIQPQIARAIYGHKLEVFDTLMSSGLVSTSSDFHTEHLRRSKNLAPFRPIRCMGMSRCWPSVGTAVSKKQRLFRCANTCSWSPTSPPQRCVKAGRSSITLMGLRQSAQIDMDTIRDARAVLAEFSKAGDQVVNTRMTRAVEHATGGR